MHSNKNLSSTALPGVSIAIIMLLLFIATLLPGGAVLFFTAISALLLTNILFINVKCGAIVFILTMFFSFLFNFSPSLIFAFGTIFGIYPFIKLKLDLKRNVIIEALLKLLSLNILLLVGFILSSGVIINIITFDFKIWVNIIILQVGFILYDILLSYFLRFMTTKQTAKAIN